MHTKSPTLVKPPASTGGRRRRDAAASESARLLLNPPPPEVCAQCARDNERRMRLYTASLFASRNHCD